MIEGTGEYPEAEEKGWFCSPLPFYLNIFHGKTFCASMLRNQTDLRQVGKIVLSCIEGETRHETRNPSLNRMVYFFTLFTAAMGGPGGGGEMHLHWGSSAGSWEKVNPFH